jgi:hypothetical protein
MRTPGRKANIPYPVVGRVIGFDVDDGCIVLGIDVSYSYQTVIMINLKNGYGSNGNWVGPLRRTC